MATQRNYLRRTLTVALAGLGLLAATPSPAQADPLPVSTYIVTYNAAPSGYQLGTLAGVTDAVHGFVKVPAAVVNAPAGAKALLRALPGVKGVYENEQYNWLSDLATQSSGADKVWDDLGWTGAGIGVAVMDAGVDGTHPDLCAQLTFCRGTGIKTVQNVKVLGRQDYVQDPVVVVPDLVNTDTGSGHGSHVAGIAAGFGTAGTDPTKYRGVAYGANIVGVGVGDVVEAVNVLAGFDYIMSVASAYNIKVINNSWGPGAFTAYDPEHPVNLAIDAAWNQGISVVFGAGNDGTRTDSLNMFSSHPRSISVASGRKDHHLAFYSSRGIPGNAQMHPTVTAPGDVITSVRALSGATIHAADAQGIAAPDGDAAQGDDVQYYAVSSGTSMAAPHISGVIALMQQAAKATMNRYLTPLEVRNILQNTASAMPAYQQYSVGAGFVNALAAVTAATTASQTQAYVNPDVTDLVPFAGTAGGAVTFATSSFSSTYTVLPGAKTMDVMIDWGPEKVLAANTDLDIDLLRPDGSLFSGTFLTCDPSQAPNGYTSYCSSAPNERLTVVNPVAGTWTVNVKPGLVGVQETVRGLWSTTYPAGTAVAPRTPATLTLATSQPVNLTGQPVELTATVKDAAGLPLANVPVALTSTGVGTVGHAMTVTDTFGRVHAQAASGAPGTQTITATAAGLTATASVLWLGIVVPALPCVLSCPAPVVDSNGKASGGGWWTASGTKRHLAFSAEHTSAASTSSGDLSYDNKAGTTVVGTGVEHLVIEGTTKATITGTATVNGNSGYRYTLVVVDNGEPGSSDTAKLTVTQPGSTWKLEDQGTLGGGNIQVTKY